MFKLIQSLLARPDFKPFTIVMTDGEHISISHRDFVIPIRGFELIIVQRPEDKEVRAIAPEHIKELLRQDAHAA